MKRLSVILSCVIILSALMPLSSFALDSGWDIPYSDFDWQRLADQNITLNVYNWGEYISVDTGEGEFDVNAEFEKLTGIKVNYSNFASNEELYAKLKSGGATYDVIIPSDYMVSRLIKEGMLEKLDFSNIPNFEHIMESHKYPVYDPTNEYSVPYMWQRICIIYNTTMVDPEDDLETWDILWNEKYANNILMFSNSRDAFALACKKLGYSMNTESESELTAAAEALKDQKMLVQAYVMDEIYDKMGGGEAALAPYYAGDALVMMEDNPDLDVVFPREGTNLFDDALCIPKGAKNKEAAELYINFVTETLVSRENSLFIGYATPQQLSYEAMDDETKENTVIYPTPDMIENDEVYVALSDTATKLMDSLWTNILSETNISPWMTPVLLVAVLGLTVFINVRRQVKKHRKSEAK